MNLLTLSSCGLGKTRLRECRLNLLWMFFYFYSKCFTRHSCKKKKNFTTSTYYRLGLWNIVAMVELTYFVFISHFDCLNSSSESYTDLWKHFLSKYISNQKKKAGEEEQTRQSDGKSMNDSRLSICVRLSWLPGKPLILPRHPEVTVRMISPRLSPSISTHKNLFNRKGFIDKAYIHCGVIIWWISAM